MDYVPGTCLGHPTGPGGAIECLHMVILTIGRDNRRARRSSVISGPIMVGRQRPEATDQGPGDELSSVASSERRCLLSATEPSGSLLVG